MKKLMIFFVIVFLLGCTCDNICTVNHRVRYEDGWYDEVCGDIEYLPGGCIKYNKIVTCDRLSRVVRCGTFSIE